MGALRRLECRVVDPILEIARGLVRSSTSRAAGWLRRKLHGTSCHLDSSVVIRCPRHFVSGTGCALYHGTYVLNTGGSVRLGDRSHLGAFCYVNAARGELRVGNDVAIGPGTKLIVHSNHHATGRRVTEEYLTADIVIGDNVFVGANCVILPGTVVEDNVVIGAGSVVKGILESNAIYAGSPARKRRDGWYG